MLWQEKGNKLQLKPTSGQKSFCSSQLGRRHRRSPTPHDESPTSAETHPSHQDEESRSSPKQPLPLAPEQARSCQADPEAH